MKVLLIGGTGLISTAITRQLVARGDEVTVFNRGKTPNRASDNVRVLTGDRKDYPAFENALSGETWDAVIDMIGYVPDDEASAIRTFQGRTGQFVFCSTVCVYGGELSRLPAAEDEPRTPTGTYGANKVKCEDLLMQAHADSGFPVTIMRPSHTYGEGGGVTNPLGWKTTYVDRVRKGKPVIVHGDGSSLWVTCHIDDVAKGFVGALGNPNAIGQAYNVTGTVPQTWNDYVRGIAEATGGDAKLVHIPTDLLGRLLPNRAKATVEIFQYNSVFDNTKAERDLGFTYTIPWVEGVKRTIDWLDANGKLENSDDDPLDDALIAAWEKAGEALTVQFGEA